MLLLFVVRVAAVAAAARAAAPQLAVSAATPRPAMKCRHQYPAFLRGAHRPSHAVVLSRPAATGASIRLAAGIGGDCAGGGGTWCCLWVEIAIRGRFRNRQQRLVRLLRGFRLLIHRSRRAPRRPRRQMTYVLYPAASAANAAAAAPPPAAAPVIAELPPVLDDVNDEDGCSRASDGAEPGLLRVMS